MGLNKAESDKTVENQQQQYITSLPITYNPKINQILKENNSHSNFNNNNSKKIFDLNQKPNDSNLGVVKTTMAPALTEPLRSANQLASSSSPNAASASPRPHAISNNSSSKKNGNRLIEFPMGPMSEPNTNITNTSSLETNNLENINDNIPITLVHLENDFEEAISAEICMKSGVVFNNSTDKANKESFEHMETETETDRIIENVEKTLKQNQPDEGNVLPSSPPATLASQHNIGSEEKLAGFDFKELPRISQDSTITASEGNDVEDNISINSNSSPTKSCSQSNNPKESNSQSVDMDLGDIDILNVFKNLESGTENLTDLAGSLNLFNDVMSYEDDISSSIISTCINTNTGISPTFVVESKELQADIKKMQRQIDFLNRRLRKLQSRNVCQQSAEEISGLFEWSNRITRRKDYEPSRLAEHEDETQRPVSAASMRTVLKKIDSISNQQRLISSKKKVGRPASTPGPTVITEKTHPLSTLIPQYDLRTIDEILQTAGSLQSELRLAEQGMDSDATLSSSGGESADENITYNNQTQQVVPIAKRAAWTYSCDRASIAARWTWLLSQISDLEYKKRQHEELYQKIKSTKGTVSLKKTCDEVPEKDVNMEKEEEEDSACRTRPFDRTAFRKRKLLQTANVHTISKKAARPSNVKCGCQWPLSPCALCTGRTDPTAPRDLPDTMFLQERASLLDNGFHPVLSFASDKSHSIHFETTCNSYDWRSRCLRCTAKSAIKSVIAAQKAAIKSERSSMQTILPGFKKNEKGELVPKRKYKKKIQVPSDFYSDDGGSGSSTPYLANKGQKISKKHHTRNNHSDEASYNHQQGHGHTLSTYHQNSNSTIPTSSSAQRNKIRKISSSTSFLNSSSISNNGNLYGGNDSFDNLNDSNLNGCRSRNSSPTHSYYRSSDRRSRNSYDIDNIVIPYSVAASTRVELLPYKEIPTPKWRMMDDDDFLLNTEEANEIINDFDKNSIDKLFDEFVTSCPNDKSENNIDGLLNISVSSSSCDITKQGIENDYNKMEKSTEIVKDSPNHPIAGDILNSPQFNESPSKSSLRNNSSDGSIDGHHIEDTSDDAYVLRHERGLQDERKKFATYLKFPFSTRSRANRRADSRTNSSGANTPDPSSPATTVPNISVDQEPIPSPTMPPTPQTPFESFENDSGLNGEKKRHERKRTTSSKKDRERSSTPDLREIVQPFDPLQFPLPNDVYEEMLKLMPPDHHTLDEYFPIIPPPVKEEDEILQTMVPPLNGLTTPNIGIISVNSTPQNVKNSPSTDLIGSIIFNNYSNSTIIDSSTILNSSENILDDSETESVETNTGEDDPNDPEWKGEAQ